VDILGDARSLLGRAGAEARFAATLLRARGAGVALIPPHRMAGVALALDAYGPIGAAIALAAAGSGDRPAVVDDAGQLTFAELDRRSSALANALVARGFRPGDSIGILCRNHRGLFEAIAAGAKLGARTLLLNTDFAGPQLVDVCSREEVAVLVHDEEFAPVAGGFRPRLGRVLAWSEALSGDHADHGRTDGGDGHRPPTIDAPTIDALVAGARSGPPPRPGHKQRVVLLTSGTTGAPKGAPRELALSLVIPGGYLSKIPLRSGRAIMLGAPAFHAWGLLSSMLALGLGNTLVMTRRFDPSATLAAMERHRCDALITVPILLLRLLAAEDEVRARDLSGLRVVAVSGSALAPELATRAMDLLGDVVYNLYGSTEVAYATIATPADLRAAPGTAGRPPFGTTIRLLDEHGEQVPRGHTGRIFVGNSIQFDGYTGGGDKERIGGLMSTGDVGHLDDEGRLFVDGRDDDMIVSGGENVFPREIEELLSSHEAVVEAAVVGVPDPDFGTRLRAYVVCAPGTNLTEADVRGLVRANLARYKVPREVVFLDELPRNPAGKIMKRQLPD
jgi:fatty-acyl-CoA synthase